MPEYGVSEPTAPNANLSVGGVGAEQREDAVANGMVVAVLIALATSHEHYVLTVRPPLRRLDGVELRLAPLARVLEETRRRRPRRLLRFDGARSSLDVRRPRRLERL